LEEEVTSSKQISAKKKEEAKLSDGRGTEYDGQNVVSAALRAPGDIR
jgi:hypothetical protein